MKFLVIGSLLVTNFANAFECEKNSGVYKSVEKQNYSCAGLLLSLKGERIAGSTTSKTVPSFFPGDSIEIDFSNNCNEVSINGRYHEITYSKEDMYTLESGAREAYGLFFKSDNSMKADLKFDSKNLYISGEAKFIRKGLEFADSGLVPNYFNIDHSFKSTKCALTKIK